MRKSLYANLLALALAAVTAASATAQDILLDFSMLPSAQGFAYTPVGSHAGVAEATVFSVAGGVLTQNTIGQYLGLTGGGIYYVMPGIIDAAATSETHVTARCLQVQGSSAYPAGQGGFWFGQTNGSTQFGFSLTPTKAYVLGPGGWFTVAGTWDNTQFADWVFRHEPPLTCKLYRNGTLVSTTTGGGAVAANRLFFGDGTGGANARGEVSSYHFLQGGAVAIEGDTWGGVKALFR